MKLIGKLKKQMMNKSNFHIVERSSGYWITDDSGVVDNKFTTEQPYVHLEEAQTILKSKRYAYLYGWKGEKTNDE